MAERCPACGRVAFLDVAEIYPETREIELTACCEANLQDWVEAIPEYPRKEVVEWLRRKAGFEVRQIVVEQGIVALDYGLEIRDLGWPTARDFVAAHHEHNKPPHAWRFGGGIYNGSELIGVVIVGNPNSRHLLKQGCMGIDRVCINRSRPSGLTWNACSMAYGWACREIEKRLPEFTRAVTYTLLDEPGTSLVAAGFRRVFKTKGGSWHRKNRPRTDKATTERKWRWERILHANHKRQATNPRASARFVYQVPSQLLLAI